MKRKKVSGVKVLHKINYVVIDECNESIASLCPECGPSVRVDEDGCCALCGATALGAWALEHVLKEQNLEPFDGFTALDAELLAKKLGMSGVIVVAVEKPGGEFSCASYGVDRQQLHFFERHNPFARLREVIRCEALTTGHVPEVDDDEEDSK